MSADMVVDTVVQAANAANAAGAAGSGIGAGLIVGVALTAGVAAGVILARRNSGKAAGAKEELSVLLPWSELQKTERVVETLDEREILEWAKPCRDEVSEDKVLLLVRANEKWITMMGYEYPKEIDPMHNVVAFLSDKKTGEAAHLRLFSFAVMSPKVEALFGEGDVVHIRA